MPAIDNIPYRLTIGITSFPVGRSTSVKIGSLVTKVTVRRRCDGIGNSDEESPLMPCNKSLYYN